MGLFRDHPKEPPKVVLEAHNLYMKFTHPLPLTVLQGVNLVAERGTTIGIMGRSGEGKSTLLHILGTLENPTVGSLSIAGQPVSPANRDAIRNRHIGFIFQSFNLLDHVSAVDNVLVPAQIARVATGRKSEARARAEALLEGVGLLDRMRYDASVLSGGERQRVAIARARMNDPDLILADEPTGNLDRRTSLQIQNLLLQDAEHSGKCLIVATHDRELYDRCMIRYVLQDGLLHRQG